MHLTKGIHLVVSRERLPLDDVLVLGSPDQIKAFRAWAREGVD